MSCTEEVVHVEKKQKFIDKDYDDDDDCKVNKIICLDYDSLAKIFMQLPIMERINMEKVCIKWKEACKLAWYDIKKYKFNESIDCYTEQSYIRTILSYCGIYLDELILSPIYNSNIMPVVGEICKNLTRLEFEFTPKLERNNSYDHFIQAFMQLDKLVYIKIKVNGNTSFPFEIINGLSENMNDIHLFFKNYPAKNIVTHSLTFKKFENLHSLTLSGCNLDHIIQEIFEKVTLVYLDLQNSKLNTNIRPAFNLVNLEYIHIMDYIDCSNIILGVLNTCKYIKHIDVSEPIIFEARDQNQIQNWRNLENLVYLNVCLDIHRNSRDLAMKIVKYCRNLEYLNISLGTGAIGYLTLNEKLEIIKTLTGLENVKSFNLYEDNICKESLLAILTSFKKLTHLDLGLTEIHHYPFGGILSMHYMWCSNSEVPEFDELPKLQYLEYLSLYSNCHIESSHMIEIANNCKRLKYLNIGHCSFIKEDGLLALTSLENLEFLNVQTIEDSVTDNFIGKLKGLKILGCGFCNQLTNAGIIQVIKNCPDLEHIILNDIDNLTSDVIYAAEKETKKRKNGIILNMYISLELIFKSQSLIVKKPIIPDIKNRHGQCYAPNCFFQYITDKLKI